jgi:hypothetical protein
MAKGEEGWSKEESELDADELINVGIKTPDDLKNKVIKIYEGYEAKIKKLKLRPIPILRLNQMIIYIILHRIYKNKYDKIDQQAPYFFVGYHLLSNGMDSVTQEIEDQYSDFIPVYKYGKQALEKEQK